jgi:chemotaxis protein methyltransferase CheR
MTQRQREPLPPDLRQDFAGLLEARLGLVFPASREPFLDQSVHDALERLGEISARVLLERLQREDAPAWSALTATVTVGETYFFREPKHYELLRALLTRAAPDRPVRLWSAACASGAEPYSMAAIACEVFGRQAPRRVEILATDVNPQVLDHARAGLYRPWLLRDMDEVTRERWFTEEDGSWRVRPVLAGMVRFEQLNLLDTGSAAWPSSMDVTFCRNVLLYFGQPALERAVQGLARALGPDGWLIVGPADPMPACVASTTALTIDATPGFAAYRRAPEAPAAGLPAPAATLPAPAATLPAPARPAPPARQHSSTPRKPRRRVRSTLPAAAPVSEPHAPDPDAGEALAQARALGDAGQTQAALAALDSAITCEPLAAEAYLLRAALRQAEGDHRGAIAEARRALLLDRTLAYAHVIAASSHAALGEGDRARRALRNARAILAMLPDDARVAGISATAAELRAACRQLQHAFERHTSPEEP